MPTASSVIADIIECAKSESNIKTVFWEDGAQSVFAGKDSSSEKYLIRTEGLSEKDIFELSPASKIIGSSFITPPLTETEVSVLEEKINEHGKLLSKIPLFE